MQLNCISMCIRMDCVCLFIYFYYVYTVLKNWRCDKSETCFSNGHAASQIPIQMNHHLQVQKEIVVNDDDAHDLY